MALFRDIVSITDHLYLSSGAAACNEPNINSRGIKCIINATTNLPDSTIPEVEHVRVPVNDVPHSNLSAHFDAVCDRIEDVRKQGGSTLVHCVGGISRSSALCLAYLMKCKNMSLEEAHSHVKARRPFIRPNIGFWRQLIEYERTLYNKNSVTIIQSNVGPIPSVYEKETQGMMW
ncbi:dual specificity protein phosphatase 14-like [Branchiostoma lanceolatum]|uniref:dual specificity protein phosphatase 14-like n=1 Tax=Branchiostoma lanceolatum TaxID=7740 RepID=UPI003451CBDA